MKCGLVFAFMLMMAAAWGGTDHCLLYLEPAPDSIQGWETRSLPLGNGHFGVSVFGGMPAERLQVTHNAVLTAREHANGETGNLTDALEK